MSAVRRSPRFVRDENENNATVAEDHQDMLVSNMFSPAKGKKTSTTAINKKRGSLSTTNTPSSGKKQSSKKNRRETADMEDLMNGLLDDSSFTVQSGFSLTADSPAATTTVASEVDSVKKGKKTATSTGSSKKKQQPQQTKEKGEDSHQHHHRRETMDQGNSLLNNLLNDSDTFKDGDDDASIVAREKDDQRRMTMNASCMDDLLDDLDSSNTSSYSVQSTGTTGRLSILLQSADKKKTMSSAKKPQSTGKNVARLSIHAVNNFLDISDDVPLERGGNKNERRQTIDAACMDDLLNDLENEESVSKDQFTVSEGDANLSGFSFSSNNFPAATKAASAVKSTKKTATVDNNRRHTIDAACMDDLLNDLENEECLSKDQSMASEGDANLSGFSFSSNNFPAVATTTSVKSVKKAPEPIDNNTRRQTIDAACMDDLLNDLENEEHDVSSAIDDKDASVNAADLSVSVSIQSTGSMESFGGLYLAKDLLDDDIAKESKPQKTAAVSVPASASKHGERRETLDAGAIDDLLNSTLSAGNDSISIDAPFTTSSIPISPATQTASLSFSKSEVVVQETASDKKKKSSKKDRRRSSSSSLALSAIPSPSANDVSDLSFNTETDDRRKTLEQTDIMKLIADEESQLNSSNAKSVDAEADMNDDDSDGNNSIDTMALMGDVDKVLNGLENQDGTGATRTVSTPSAMDTSNVSELSDISFASSVRLPQNNKERNPRRETVDSVDVAWLLEEIENPDGSILGSNTKESRIDTKNNRSSTGEEDDASICTLDLVNAVADTLDDTSVVLNKSKKNTTSSVLSTKSKKKDKSATKEKQLFQSPSSKTTNSKKSKSKSPSKKKSLRDSFGNKVVTRVPENEQDEAVEAEELSFLNNSNVSDNTTNSLLTVGTMDLIDSVKFALEEDERNRDRPHLGDDSDCESVTSMAPLEDLLRRCREQDDSTNSPFVDASRAVGNKRKSISPLDAIKASRPSTNIAAALVAAHLSPVSMMKAVPQAPHSILKSAKKAASVNVQLNRSVVFGSPNVAEFNKASPTTSFTPMDKDTAKKMFQLPLELPLGSTQEGEEEEEEDEVTQENEMILEEWDRLTNASSCGSDEEDDHQRFPGDTETYFEDIGSPVASPAVSMGEDEGSVTASGRKKKGGRRRKSMLQPKLDFGDDLEAEQAAAPTTAGKNHAFSVLSPAVPSYGSEADDSSMMANSGYEDPDNVTHTVQLPNNLADLLAQNQVMDLAALPAAPTTVVADQSSMMEQSMMSNQSRTVEIETDLKALLANIDGRHSFAAMGGNFDTSGQSSRSSSSGSNPLQISRSSLGSNASSEGRMSLLSHLEGDSILSLAGHHNKDLSSASMASSAADSSGTNSILQGLNMPAIQPFAIHQDQDYEEGDAYGYGEEEERDPIDDEEAQFLAEMEAQERSALEEDLRQLIPSRDASAYLNEDSQSLAAAGSQQGSIYSDYSHVSAGSQPSQQPSDNSGEAVDSFREELSFVETKRRMFLDQSSIGNQSPVMNTSHDMLNTSKVFLNQSLNQSINQSQVQSQLAAKTNDLMSRLRALNAGARNNTLAQCSTPGVSNQRLSMGMRRQSFRPSLCPNVATIPTPRRKSIAPKPATSQPVAMEEIKPVVDVPVAIEEEEVVKASTIASATVLEEEPEEQQVEAVQSIEIAEQEEMIVEEEVVEEIVAPIAAAEPTSQELFGMDLKQFFSTIQQMKQHVAVFMNEQAPETVRNYVTSVLFDTLASASFGTFLTEVPRELLEKAFSFSLNDFEAFYAMINEKANMNIDSFDMNLRLMAMPNWQQVWVNLATSALTEMTEILMQHDQKQLILLQQRGLLDVKSSGNANKIIEKMLGASSSGNISSSSSCAALDISSDEKLLIPTIAQFKKNLEREEEEILEQEQELVDSEMLYEITNRLSFYRLVSYSSTMLQLEIFLTPHATVSIKLGIAQSEEGSDKMMITDTDVDLMLEDGENAKLSSAENSLIAAFFTHLLANDEAQGPLSVANLSNITEVAHLPMLLEGISGYIGLLRRAIKSLEPAVMKGGNYIVTRSEGSDLLIRIVGKTRSSVITSSLTPFFAFLQRREESKESTINEIAQFIEQM